MGVYSTDAKVGIVGGVSKGIVKPGGRRLGVRGRTRSPMRSSALRRSCAYTLVMVSPSCCWMYCLGVGAVWECP